MRQCTKAYIFAGMLLGIVIFPGLLLIPLKEYVNMENYKDRICQGEPALNFRNLKVADLRSYPGQYDVHPNDHLALKNPIVAFGKLADIHVLGEVTSGAVLIGKDGWISYKPEEEMEDSIADYQGTNCYNEEDLRRFVVLLKQADGNPASGGTKLVFHMVPNKEQMYNESMPSSVKMVQKQSKADLLYAHLKGNADCDVHHPLDEFRKAKDDRCQIYREHDTRWNDMRVFMASWMVIQGIDGEPFGPESYHSYDTENRGTFSGDLAAMLNLQRYYDDDPFLKVPDCRGNVSFEVDYQSEHETITYYSPDAERKAGKILICRGSFRVHMVGYFAKNYPDVTLTDYRTEDCGAAALEFQPDAVVIEVMERHMDCMFGLLERLRIIGYGMELVGD